MNKCENKKERFFKYVYGSEFKVYDDDDEDCGSDEGCGGDVTSSGGYFDSNCRNPWMTCYTAEAFYFERYKRPIPVLKN